MHVRVLAALGIAVSGLAAYLLTADVDPSKADGPTWHAPDTGAEYSRPVLRGRAEPKEPAASLPWLEALLAGAVTGTQDEQHAAVRAIQKRYHAGEIPVEELVPWALSSTALGGCDELASWARRTTTPDA